jgi:drug/metabolite transporter (DMT)-like permease
MKTIYALQTKLLHFCKPMAKQNLTSWVLFILLSLIWGSSFILMKKTAEELTGWQIGAIRICAAGLVFLPFAIFHIRSIPARKIPVVVLSGVLGNLLPAFLFGIAIDKRINSSLAGILNSLTPLFVIVIGILFFRVTIQPKKIAGVIVGFIGLLLLFLSKGNITMDDFGFSGLILLATLLYGFNVNMVGIYLRGIDPIKMATVSMAAIGIPAAFIVVQQQVIPLVQYDVNARVAVGIVALLGITGTAIATALFYTLIQKAGGLFASLVTYVIPMIAIFWGLLDGETVTAVQGGCLLMILGGVYLANR